MIRIWAYLIGWFYMTTVINPIKACANTEKSDSVRRIEEAFDRGDYDYILPAEAQAGTIPFTRAGNLIIIQATVDTLSGNFILDTGAPGLILNFTYFRHMEASIRVNPEAAGITGGILEASPTLVNKLKIGDFDYSKVNADRVGLGHIENSKGIRILGLLGAGLFKRFEMVIDYAKEEIYLHRAAANRLVQYKNVYHGEAGLFYTVPIKIQEGKIMAQIQIGKKNRHFVLDTGAETSILDSRLPKDVMANVEMVRKISLIGTGSKKTEAWYGLLQNAFIGPVSLDSIEVLVTSLAEMAAAYGRNMDGMLGATFFIKQKVGINFINNELYIWK